MNWCMINIALISHAFDPVSLIPECPPPLSLPHSAIRRHLLLEDIADPLTSLPSWKLSLSLCHGACQHLRCTTVIHTLALFLHLVTF